MEQLNARSDEGGDELRDQLLTHVHRLKLKLVEQHVQGEREGGGERGGGRESRYEGTEKDGNEKKHEGGRWVVVPFSVS